MIIPRKNIVEPIHRSVGAFLRRSVSSSSVSVSSTTSIGEWITIEKTIGTDGDHDGSNGGSSSIVAKLIMKRPPANSLTMGECACVCMNGQDSLE